MKLEIVRDFDGLFYCNLKKIAEYITLSELRQALKNAYNIKLSSINKLDKTQTKRKTYFYFETDKVTDKDIVGF